MERTSHVALPLYNPFTSRLWTDSHGYPFRTESVLFPFISTAGQVLLLGNQKSARNQIPPVFGLKGMVPPSFFLCSVS